MKKMLIAIIILLLIVIFLLLYCNCKKKCVLCDDKGKPGTDSCKVFCNENPGHLEGMISYNELVRITRLYAGDDGKSTITGTGEDDALSMVFDLKKIKTLLWQIDNHLCRNHCDSNARIGIRYYYVKYPPEIGTLEAADCYDGIGVGEKNKHALVMVPVHYVDGKGWVDFDIWRFPNECFHRFEPQDIHGVIPAPSGVPGADGGDNHGGIGPPPGSGIFPTNED